jgi:hypothetical protein
MIDPQQLINNEESLLLNEFETEAAKQLEEWIDNEILRTFSARQATVKDFDDSSLKNVKELAKYKSLSDVRRKIVKKVTMKRYKELWDYEWVPGYEGFRDENPGAYSFTPKNTIAQNKSE